MSKTITGLVCLIAWFLASFAISPVRASLLYIQSQTPGSPTYRINSYDSAFSFRKTIIPPLPPATSDLIHPRDLVVERSGRLHLFNGTFDPYLSTFDPVVGTWTHTTHPGWSTVGTNTYGGIAQIGDKVFVSNMTIVGKPSEGIVVFDMDAGTSSEFASGLPVTDLARGLDGSLWALVRSAAIEFDPDNFTMLRTVSLVDAVGFDIRSIAVDFNGDFFVGDFGGILSRLNSAGHLLDSFNPASNSIHDIDISRSGLLAIGTRTRGTWLSNREFTSTTQIESNRWDSFVTFREVPEQNCSVMMLIVPVLAGLRRRRGA